MTRYSKALSALIDQALLSATVFATGFLLARSTEPQEFGTYVLVFQTLLFSGGFQSALVSQPMVVLGQRSDTEFRSYASSLASASVVASTGMAAVIFASSRWAPAHFAASLHVLAISIIFVQGQEFCRQVLFAQRLPAHVLANDLVCCAARMAALAWMWRTSTLSAPMVLLAIGASSGLGLAIGLIQIRRWVRPVSPRACHLLENWQFGRWVLGTYLAGSLLLFGNTAVVAAMAGAAAAGTLEAHRLILAPIQVLATGAVSVLAPELARVYSQAGREALVRMVRLISGPLALAFISYATAVGVAPNLWLSVLYPGKYAGTATVLVLSTLAYAVAGLRVLPWAALSAQRRPDLGMWAGLVAGVLSLFLTGLLTHTSGLAGAASARLIGEIILFGSGIELTRRLMRPTRIEGGCNEQMPHVRVL